ncbi:MAG: hypothetical protein BGN88_12070 [Clostridiales bacterium 43-6]|nr:MAG: hypothetical protein BGN88_12070 [Clostridiales bacterium 43-6]
MYGAMISLILTILMFAFSLAFKVTGKLRLSIPIIYFILLKTVFYQFERDYKFLSNLILYALVALVLISWIYSLIKAIQNKRQERFLAGDAEWQIQKAKEMGIPLDNIKFDEKGNMLDPRTGKPIVYHDSVAE